MPSRTRTIVFTGAAALGIAAGAAGIAAAATSGDGADTESHDESHDDAAEFTSSLTVDDTTEYASEADEAAHLATIVSVTPEQAVAAATAQVPGNAADPELENEDGSVVYSVEVTQADGSVVEVVVDAGNASILQTESEGADGHDDVHDEGHDDGHDGEDPNE